MMRNDLRKLGVRGLVIATLLVTGARAEEDVQEPNDEEQNGRLDLRWLRG